MAHFLSQIKLSGDSRLQLTGTRDYLDCVEAKRLKAKIKELESRNMNLVYEIEKTNIDLEHEKRKVSQLETQLKFLKDNQAIFDKLKEAYLSVKSSKAPGRKLVEVRDKSVQTWEGVLCRACLDTEKLRTELEHAKAAFDDCVVIKRDAMDKINTTVQALKKYMGDNNNCVKLIEELKPKVVHFAKSADPNTSLKRRNKARPSRYRSLSADRGCSRILNLTYSFKHKCKISKSLIDVGQKNCYIKKLNP